MHIMSSEPDDELLDEFWEHAARLFPGYGPGEPARKYETAETAVVVMRHLRRLAKSQGYRRKTEVVRMSLNQSTGDQRSMMAGAAYRRTAALSAKT